MNIQTYAVPFFRDKIYLIENDGQPFVPVRQLCEKLGLSWSRQYRKLNEQIDRWGVAQMATPTAGGTQEMVCIPLRKVFAWLGSIHPNKVNPAYKTILEIYQEQCDEVLENYWLGIHSKREKYLVNQAAILAGELIAKKPIYAKVLELWRVGERDFNAYHAAFNYSKVKLIDCFHQLLWLNLIEELPLKIPAVKMQPTLIVKDGLQYELFDEPRKVADFSETAKSNKAENAPSVTFGDSSPVNRGA